MIKLILLAFFLALLPLTNTKPQLKNVKCTPSKVPLGKSVNITWELDDDPKHPARGVFSWQLHAENAIAEVDGEEQPINGPASTSLLTSSNIEADFDWYRYGPYGAVNYTGQAICLDTSLPYGDDTDGLGNPEGYVEQSFCPLECTIAPPYVNYTVFTDLDFKPKRVRVGNTINITWAYEKGVNFPRNILLSIFFASNYFEEYPQFILPSVPAAPGQYSLRVGQALRAFVTSNVRKVDGRFPYRLYMQLSFPPQTNALGGLVAGNLTILPAKTGKKDPERWRRTWRMGRVKARDAGTIQEPAE